MFRETLLESAPGARRRKRWPMILAVALEVTVCSLLVALPLFSTGIIPVSARTPVVFPQLQQTPIVRQDPVSHDSGQGPVMPGRPVFPIADRGSVLRFGHPAPPGDDDSSLPPNVGVGPTGQMPICDACTSKPGGPGEKDRLHNVSEGVSQGYILRRVEPIYPRPALLAGIRGEVRLHAIIAKDGTIQSLTLVSGHPLLARAAIDAVEQWRYRPFLLNHEPVEVETSITVNFTGTR